jgi:hypothetical protein
LQRCAEQELLLSSALFFRMLDGCDALKNGLARGNPRSCLLEGSVGWVEPETAGDSVFGFT